MRIGYGSGLDDMWEECEARWQCIFPKGGCHFRNKVMDLFPLESSKKAKTKRGQPR
jgi:hypothetical protein